MYKVMIVDDEAVIRNGLIRLISWESMACEVIADAPNGVQAIELLKECSPDIILTDIKMPGCNGIELSRYIYENEPTICVIMLTGYADFEFAQAALQYNVIDFLLKPTDPQKVAEAVNRAQKRIMQRETNQNAITTLENRVTNYLKELKEKKISDTIQGLVMNADSHDLDDFEKNFPSYLLFLYEAQDAPEKLSPEKSLLFSRTRSFLSVSFQKYLHNTVLTEGNRVCLLISLPSVNNQAAISSALEISRETLTALQQLLKIQLSAGVSQIHSGAQQLNAAYQEAKDALSQQFYEEESECRLYLPLQITKPALDEKEKILPLLEQIIQDFQNGQLPPVIASIQTLFTLLNQQKPPIYRTKKIAIQLCSELEILLLKYDIDFSDALPQKENIYKAISESTSCQQLSTLLTESVILMYDKSHNQSNQNNRIVQKALQYIQEQYATPITLQSVADYVHTSCSYFCRLFKKCAGLTVTDAINQTRVEHAKDLLRNSNLKTYEIASQVGIPDPAYFSVIFKKHTGVSPTDYLRQKS